METRPSEAVQFREKFIAFVDLLGFKRLVEDAERGARLSLDELLSIVGDLGNLKDRDEILQFGPSVCPDSARIKNDVDFQLTQISDCIVISAEISPLGVLTLIDQAWKATFRLLQRGILCRGYITRGSIYHTENQFVGSGYVAALDGERSVAAFREKGEVLNTPYVEIGDEVSRYVANETDTCVRTIFERLVIRDSDLAVLSPFNQLIIATFGDDEAQDRQSIRIIRENINGIIRKVESFADKTSPSFAKTRHYLLLLEAKLARLDRIETGLAAMRRPFGIRATRDVAPGLFVKPDSEQDHN